MTAREPRPLQPRAVAAWVGGTLAGLAALVSLREPELFVWDIVACVFLWAGWATFKWLQWADRAVTAETKVFWQSKTSRTSNHTPEETCAIADSIPETSRRLRIVEQRQGDHDHLADDDDWFARLCDDKGELR